MEIMNVGLMSPGDMGEAIARRIAQSGLSVHTALDGRSARTRAIAAEAGLHDCGSLEGLVAACDMIVSVVSPGLAPELAGQVAAAMRTTGRGIAFADLNAISPGTALDEDRVIRAAGGTFIDGAIIGPPPRGEQDRPRIYVSGPAASLFEQIRHPNIPVRRLSDRVGDASALKMCYGAMTKGTTAIMLELLLAAHELGVEEAVVRELRESRSDVFEWQMRSVGAMPSKARRWVPEMEAISRTFDELGLTPRIFEGAADLFTMVARTPIAQETPAQARAAGRGGLDVTRSIAGARRTIKT